MVKISVRSGTKTLTTSVTFVNGNYRKTIKFGALAHNYKLSPSGRFFYIHLANSKSNDSRKFIKLNTENLERVYAINPEWGIADDYLFPGGSDTIYIKLKFGLYPIDDEGLITNRKDYYSDLVRSGGLSSIEALPTFFVLNGESDETFKIAIDSMDKVLTYCKTLFHGLSWGAQALKAKAQVLASMGKTHEALQCCVDAIEIYPKVTAKQMRNNYSRKLKVNLDDIKPSAWAVEFKSLVEKERDLEMKKIAENQRMLSERNGISSKTIVAFSSKPDGKSRMNKSVLWLGVLAVVILVLWLSRN